MKKLFIGIFLLLTLNGIAQDTTRVEQYCRLIAINKLLSNKVNIDVDFGQERKLFSDRRLRDEETGKLKSFNTTTDALNYMGAQGWMLVNAYPVIDGGNVSYHFYFKKWFLKEELR